jgi:ornithine cyclodeaminase/alanine dehydrogenase-like protein (mu-crystallin family)
VPGRPAGELWLRFLSGPDIDSLGLSSAEIVAAVEEAVRAHGDGRAVVEPRVHLVPDNDGAGHWREAQSGRFGALRRHVDSGRLSAASLHAELGQIVAGHRPGRERNDERILLWHRGLAILDIAVGVAILRRAEQQGIGTMLRYR